MNTLEILNVINEIIVYEKGRAITMDGMLLDAELDSLGTIFVLMKIDEKFTIFNPDDLTDDVSKINFKTFIVKDLINKCILPMGTIPNDKC